MPPNSRTVQKFKHDAGFMPLSAFERFSLKKLCHVAVRLDNWSLIPATSSNFSMRCGDGNAFFITRSAVHKRLLTPNHFIRVTLAGQPMSPFAPRPSDETLLHSLIYQKVPSANFVLHCHAPVHEVAKAPGITFHGHELLKALGAKDHETPLSIPVYPNSQNMAELSCTIATQMDTSPKSHEIAFILQHHGIYCYGSSLEQSLARLEALLYLLNIEQQSTAMQNNIKHGKLAEQRRG